MRKNQKGFTVVEGLLILVIVGIIGGAGWYVWSSNKKANDSLSKADESSHISIKQPEKKTSDQTTKSSADETASWKEEKNIEFGYSYKYPHEGWSSFINKTEVNSPAYKSGERINSTGVNYDGCGRNCGLAFSLQVFVKSSNADVGSNYVENVQMKGNNYYKLSSKTTVTKSGIGGTRWEYEPGDSSAAKIIYYYFANNKFSHFVQVNSNGAKADKIDITERGEKIFSTFQFIK